MDINKILKTKKFTEISNLFEFEDDPIQKIEGRPLYLLKNGVFIAYSTRKFVITGMERYEYGDTGEYALNVYCFASLDYAKQILKLEEDQIHNEGVASEVINFDKNFKFGDSIRNIKNGAIKNNYIFAAEGECKTLDMGKFVFSHIWLDINDFRLFFCDKRQPKLVGFQYNLND